MELQNFDNFHNSGISSTEIIQRLGYDSNGKRLVIDGIVGPKTLGAIYVDPFSVSHPLVKTAMGELLSGVQEVGGNNRGEDIKKYMRNKHYPGAWCAGFASWCLRETYGPGTPYIRGAQRLGREVAKLGLGKLSANDLEAGDLIIWNRDGRDEGDDPWDDWYGHVGIVIGRASGFVWTIEGNAGARRGAVRAYRYPESNLDRGENAPFMFGARYTE